MVRRVRTRNKRGGETALCTAVTGWRKRERKGREAKGACRNAGREYHTVADGGLPGPDGVQYNGKFYMTHTASQPLRWTEDGWYVVDESRDLRGIRPMHPSLSDDFSSAALGWQWNFDGKADRSVYRTGGGVLCLRAAGTGYREGNRLGVLPMDISYTAEVSLEAKGGAEGSFTYCYHSCQDRWMYSGFLYGNGVLRFRNDMYQSEHPLPLQGTPDRLDLRMEKAGQNLRFFYRTDGMPWIKVETTLDVTGYNHNVLGGYTAPRLTLGASGSGEVMFRGFVYTPA